MAKKTLTPIEELTNAYMLSAFKHKRQFDKGGKPYFEHTLAVAELCTNQDPQVRAGCLLHDVIEDTSETASGLRKKGFSDRVIRMVLAVTKIDGEDYDTYLSRIESNPDAVAIKMADLRHNSDLTRLKGGGTEKDIERTVKYLKAYARLSAKMVEYTKRGYPNYIYKDND